MSLGLFAAISFRALDHKKARASFCPHFRFIHDCSSLIDLLKLCEKHNSELNSLKVIHTDAFKRPKELLEPWSRDYGSRLMFERL